MAKVHLRKRRSFPSDGWEKFGGTVFQSTFQRYSARDINDILKAASITEVFDTGGDHIIQSDIAVATAQGQSYRRIVQVKRIPGHTGRSIEYVNYNGAVSGSGTFARFDLGNATIIDGGDFGTGWTFDGAFANTLADGWVEIEILFTTAATDGEFYEAYRLLDSEGTRTYDGDGASGLLLANPELELATGANIPPQNVILPTIAGDGAVGFALTGSNGSWNGSPVPTYTYQWMSNGGAIPGETTTSYTPVAGDVGDSITFRVTASNGIGAPVVATSAAVVVTDLEHTAPVNVVLPSIQGEAIAELTLSASQGTWTGYPTPTFTYQWKRDGVNISGATNVTYTLTTANDVGTQISVTVTATNDVAAVAATSDQTAEVVSPDSLSQDELDRSVFMATNGNDTTGTGAVGAPYLTLAKCVTEVRANGSKDTIYVRGGDYFMTTHVILSKALGDDNTRIIGFPGEVARLHAGGVPTGWTNLGGGLWSATLTSQFASTCHGFVWNDVEQQCCRLPKDPNTFFTADFGTFGTADLIYKAAEITAPILATIQAAFADARLQVFAYASHGWTCALGAPNSINTTTRRIGLSSWSPGDTLAQGCRYYFRRAFDTGADLAEGEWCNDGTTLFYRPVVSSGFTGSEPNTYVRSFTRLIQATGTADGSRLLNFRLQNLHFSGTMATAAHLVSDGTVIAPWNDGLVVDRCTFNHVGISVQATDLINGQFIENEVCWTDAQGMSFRNDNLLSKNNYIAGNYVHDIANILRHRSALSGGPYFKIEHNLCERTSQQAIGLGRSNWEVQYNEIREHNMDSSDTGGVYTGQTQGTMTCTGGNIRANRFTGQNGKLWDTTGNPVPNGTIGVRDIYYDDGAGGISDDYPAFVEYNICRGFQAFMSNTGDNIRLNNNAFINNLSRIHANNRFCNNLHYTRNVYKSASDELQIMTTTGVPMFHSEGNSHDLTATTLNSTLSYGRTTAQHLSQGYDATSLYTSITFNPDTGVCSVGAPPGWTNIDTSKIGLPGYVRGKPSVNVRNTIMTAREGNIIDGGRIIELTCLPDKWAATVGANNAVTTALLNGITGGGGTGWAAVRTALTFANVARTDDHIVTITLPAVPSYAIAADEQLAIVIPATAFATWPSAVTVPFPPKIKNGRWAPTDVYRAAFWTALDLTKITKDGGNLVSDWLDSGALALNFTQATGGNKPLYNATAINGNPGIEFSSATKLMNLTVNSGREYNFFAFVFHNDTTITSATAQNLFLNSAAGTTGSVQFGPAFASIDNEVIFMNTPGGRVAWMDSPAWQTGEVLATAAKHRRNAGKIYQSTTAGTCGATAPIHTLGNASDGGVTWTFLKVDQTAVTSIPAGNHVLFVYYNSPPPPPVFADIGWDFHLDSDLTTNLRNYMPSAGANLVMGLARIMGGASTNIKLGAILMGSGNPFDMAKFRTWVTANFGF